MPAIYSTAFYSYQNYLESRNSFTDHTKLANLTEVIDCQEHRDIIIGEHLEINGLPTGLLFKKPYQVKLDFVNQTTIKITRVISEGIFWNTVEEHLIDLPQKGEDVWIYSEGEIGTTKFRDKTGLFTLDAKEDAKGNFIGYALQLQHGDDVVSETGLLFKSGSVKVEYLNKKNSLVKVTQIIPGIFTDSIKTYYLNIPEPGDRLWIHC